MKGSLHTRLLSALIGAGTSISLTNPYDKIPTIAPEYQSPGGSGKSNKSGNPGKREMIRRAHANKALLKRNKKKKAARKHKNRKR